MSQSPSLRGSGRFFRRFLPRGDLLLWSQSPSLRGSGRFLPSRRPSPSATSCLNPLHCGAVVASFDRPIPPHGGGQVSIPFIAGQWSLRAPRSMRRSMSQRLNPLHCGAVVASVPQARLSLTPLRVSIPFIAGQWSLPFSETPLLSGGARVSIPFIAGQWSLQAARRASRPPCASQSPSLRGSGRFEARAVAEKQARRASQSPSLRGSGRFEARREAEAKAETASQSPSLRGSGRFRDPSDCGRANARVSIPFIAGQWSLRPRPRPPKADGGRRLNPLHCGAVVASSTSPPRFPATTPRLNPLHCGAVVASIREDSG